MLERDKVAALAGEYSSKKLKKKVRLKMVWTWGINKELRDDKMIADNKRRKITAR